MSDVTSHTARAEDVARHRWRAVLGVGTAVLVLLAGTSCTVRRTGAPATESGHAGPMEPIGTTGAAPPAAIPTEVGEPVAAPPEALPEPVSPKQESPSPRPERRPIRIQGVWPTPRQSDTCPDSRVVVTTTVADPDGRGISRVQFIWFGPDGRRHVRTPTSPSTGAYVTTLGAFTAPGTITFFSIVVDSEGGEITSDPGELAVERCPTPTTISTTTTTTTTVRPTTTTTIRP